MSKFIFFASLFSLYSIHSTAADCSSWLAQSGVSCIDNYGEMGRSWKRQCSEKPCIDLDPRPNRVIFAHGCNFEETCASINPVRIQTCSAWREENGVSCASHTGNFEQKWSRICVKGGYAESFCSDDINPNQVSSCTAWEKVDGESCQAPSGDWEDKWERQCVNDIYSNTRLCSDRGPY